MVVLLVPFCFEFLKEGYKCLPRISTKTFLLQPQMKNRGFYSIDTWMASFHEGSSDQVPNRREQLSTATAAAQTSRLPTPPCLGTSAGGRAV